MKLGLISDSHGDGANVKRALQQLTGELGVTVIAHLGDEWVDAAQLAAIPGIQAIAVPGAYDPQYGDPAVPNRVVRELDGWRILFTHTGERHKHDLPDDPDPAALSRDRAVDVVAYGHTHAPSLVNANRVLWVNPGHLRTGDNRGFKPSFAVLDLQPDGIEAVIHDLKTGWVLSRMVFPRMGGDK